MSDVDIKRKTVQTSLDRWIFGSAVCDLWNSIDVHASTVSTLHLCAISFDRFYAIVKPFDYDHFMNTYSAMGMITAAWLCPAAISFVPIFLGWYTTQQHLEVLEASSSHISKILFSASIDNSMGTRNVYSSQTFPTPSSPLP